MKMKAILCESLFFFSFFFWHFSFLAVTVRDRTSVRVLFPFHFSSISSDKTQVFALNVAMLGLSGSHGSLLLRASLQVSLALGGLAISVGRSS
jgi:hypothetical protein